MTISYLERGEYAPTESSRALPVLSSGTLTEFLARSQTEDQYQTLLAFEEWLRVRENRV
jgi:hypothetical protein